jgi:hypothetical protein
VNALLTWSGRVSERAWVIAVVVAGLLSRAVVVTVLDYAPESDYLGYQTMALNLLAGRGVTDQAGNRAMLNAGYPILVLVPVFAAFNNSLFAAQVANVVLGAVGVVLTYLVAREAGADRMGRLLAAAFWAFYLPSWVYAEYLAKENLMIPLMLGIVWCALRLGKGITVGVAVLCGALFGLIALTGNSALSQGLMVFVALLLSPVSFGRKAQGAVIIGVIMLCFAVPWMLRNHHAIGALVLNTNGGFNLYLGNNPAANGYFVSIAATPRGPTWHALRSEGEAVASETLRREAVEWIKENPGRFIALSLRKAALFWMPPVHEGKGPQPTVETLIRRLWLAEYLVLVAAALGSVFVISLRRWEVLILWLAVTSFTIAHMPFYVIFRYREAIVPVVCVLAGLTTATLLARVVRGEYTECCIRSWVSRR